MKKQEWQARIKDAEMSRDFSRQINVVPPEKYEKLTSDFVFIKKGILNRIFQACMSGISLIAGIFWNGIVKGMKIKGRKNLKGIKSAIVTCNHINEMDCMMVKQAVFGHKLYITVGEFNNRRGLFGKCLRAGGVLPFSENAKCMQKLTHLINELLAKNKYVLFYPEAALWHSYEKPRPTQNGAYHFAARNNVPIIPIFITFKELNKFQRLYRKNKTVVVNILEPIYPNIDLTKKDNIDILKQKDYLSRKECYEDFYKKKLEYLPQKEPVIKVEDGEDEQADEQVSQDIAQSESIVKII